MITAEEFIDFLCIGAPRSGTTWLAEALREHPQIWIPPAKELHFFNDKHLHHQEFRYERGIDYYRRQFDKAPRTAVIGELTPIYYADPNAAARIYRHFPDVRLLVLLRNPAEVVYSYYLIARAYMKIGETFESAIQEHPELLELGFYHRSLVPFFDLFPREHIYVRIHEHFFRNLAEECAHVYRFLGVDSSFKPSVLGKRINATKEVRWQSVVLLRHYVRQLANLRPLLPVKRLLTRTDFLDGILKKIVNLNLKEASLPSLDPKLRTELTEKYAADVAQLEKLLDIRLDVWKN